MIPIASSLPLDFITPSTADVSMNVEGEEDWEEFSSHLTSIPEAAGNESILDIIDNSKASLQKALEITAAHPTAKNMFETTRHLSRFDLQTLVVGKVVDKATKGIDRMLNMQ